MSAFVLAKLCKGCQRCMRACPRGAIVMRGNLAIVDPTACMDCEECMEVCMHGAITTVSVQPGIHVK
jgi:ferredoxin